MCKKPELKAASEEVEEAPYHAMSYEEVFDEIGVSKTIAKDGLTTAEAQSRLERYGPNMLTEKEKVTLLQKIWAQVSNVLVGILVVVAVVSFAKAITAKDAETALTNWIEVGLIIGVIT